MEERPGLGQTGNSILELFQNTAKFIEQLPEASQMSIQLRFESSGVYDENAVKNLQAVYQSHQGQIKSLET